MAYSTKMAAALSGATERQLHYWRRTDLMPAEYQSANRVFYSFRDLVALRTFVFLRERTSLHRIRAAVSQLRGMGELEHLSAYRLVVVGKGITFVRDSGDATELVHRPGQGVLVHMEQVVAPFTTMDGRNVPDLQRPFPHVHVDPAMRGGHPVVAGTRIGYEVVAWLLEDGVTPEEISDYYPSVSADAARDALAFARYVERSGEVLSAV